LTSSARLSTRAFWGLASWVLPLGVVFVVSPRLLHLLGAERFGALMIVMVTPLVASQLDLGISSAAVRRLAGRLHAGRVDASTTLLTLFIALLSVGLALGALLWVGASTLSNMLGFSSVLGAEAGRDLARACALWAVVSLASVLPGLLARASQALLLITVVQTTATVGLWIGAWLLLQHGATLTRVVTLGITLTALSAATTLLALRLRVDWSGRLSFDLGSLAADRRFAAGMFAAQAAGAIVYQGDRILVSALASTATAGLYALCVNIANKTSAAAVAINSFVMPLAAGLESSGQRGATIDLVHALDRATAAMLVPVLAPALLLAGVFMQLWLGSFATAELVLAFRILLVAFAIPAFAMPVSNILVAAGGAGLSARYAWLTVVVLLCALLALVPRFGLPGAAGAMLLANATSLLFVASARRSLALPANPGRRRFWTGLALGSIAQIAIVAPWIGRINTWWALLLLASAAWAASYLLRAIFRMVSPEERQVLKRIGGYVRRG